MRENIPNICISVNGNMIGSQETFTHYLLHNININKNMMVFLGTFIHLIGKERIKFKI